MKKVYYVGDWAILTGPVFAETPFHHSPKGLEIFNYGIWLKEALEKDPTYQVNSVSAWDFYNNLGPGDYEQILKDYDLIIFSDVDAKLFQLSPKFFDRSKFSGLVRTEIKKDKTVISGLGMLSLQQGVWAQAGYNTLYGVSAGLGVNISPSIAIEYNYERGMGNFSNLGGSHEFAIAYKFKTQQVSNS